MISLLEFRECYGYTCRRGTCVYCQGIHSRGMGRRSRCKNGEQSGTRYCVRRVSGATISVELSAAKAWRSAYEREQDRFAPILIARDALAEGRFVEALTIADQLDDDLGAPLSREITRAITRADPYLWQKLSSELIDAQSEILISQKTDALFWQSTDYKPGKRLDPADPEDRKMIPIWRGFFQRVQQEARSA